MGTMSRASDSVLMIGTGASLNVAVAGSLVLYRLAGFL
jgi:tRNA G18 (ribose-2'-O)-methylase SpoU